MALNVFSPVKMGKYMLKNRVFMAPMTRNRSELDLTPNKLWSKTYYEQRASAGLIIGEATQFGPTGQGYPLTPGCYTPSQIAEWKKIIDAVHAKDGVFFMQLWDCGRASHSSFKADGRVPAAPSAVPITVGTVLTMTGPQAWEVPRALTEEEIEALYVDFRTGVEGALEAGSDGIEIHGANGYLIDQFLRDGTNKRTDDYGGSLENRSRFLFKLVDIAVEIAGADRVGVRLSPGGSFLGCLDSDTLNTFTYVIKKLNDYGLAYLHLKESDEQDTRHGGEILKAKLFRPHFSGSIIVSTGYTKELANEVIAAGDADAIAFGRLFLANPDLPARLAMETPVFNEPDFGSFFGGTEVGYIDYPALSN